MSQASTGPEVSESGVPAREAAHTAATIPDRPAEETQSRPMSVLTIVSVAAVVDVAIRVVSRACRGGDAKPQVEREVEKSTARIESFVSLVEDPRRG
jgi:hypothetical protein